MTTKPIATNFEIVNRADAKSRGLTRYFIGDDCEYGHNAQRQVSNGSCVECCRIRVNKYRRAKRIDYLKSPLGIAWIKEYSASPESKAMYAIKYRSTPKGKIASHIRDSMRRVLKGSGQDKNVGYTSSDLVTHLERQFTGKMTWDNHGHAWEIDHIIPVKWFLSNNITDVSVVNALSNLRPLCKIANRKKSGNREFLI